MHDSTGQAVKIAEAAAALRRHPLLAQRAAAHKVNIGATENPADIFLRKLQVGGMVQARS